MSDSRRGASSRDVRGTIHKYRSANRPRQDSGYGENGFDEQQQQQTSPPGDGSGAGFRRRGGNSMDASGLDDLYKYRSQGQRRPARDRREIMQSGDADEIKTATKDARNETRDMTKRMVGMLQQSEENARNTLNMLGKQSEQLINADSALDDSGVHAEVANERTTELERLNKSIFNPASYMKLPVFERKKARERDLARKQELELEMQDRRLERARFEKESRMRIAQGLDAVDPNSGMMRSRRDLSASHKAAYLFEADDEDIQAEQDIEDDMDKMAASLRTLKTAAHAMNSELADQNGRIDRMTLKSEMVNERVSKGTRRLQKI
jgi:hypothetical protein